MLYLLHGCKGCKKIARGALPQIFHSAIFSMDDEIYWKEYVPRVLNPWLMQYHSIFRNIRLFHQSTARTILGRPISAHMIDVNQPVVPVVKLVFCGLWDGDKNKSMTCTWPARVILSGRKFVANRQAVWGDDRWNTRAGDERDQRRAGYARNILFSLPDPARRFLIVPH